MTTNLSPGDTWPGHYRGYRLHTNPDRDVWWQVYQGTDRLFVDPTPDDLVDELLALKHLGGRTRVTEGNEVIARVEDGDGYRTVYVGQLELSGELVPSGESEFGVQIRPQDLSAGDIWPSVYDGSKLSFSGDRVWWTNPETHKRHPVETALPPSVTDQLNRLKPRGGSFVVTPWNDVVTLVEDPPNPERAREQLHDLPRVVKNIILLRRERGVELLPVYVGSIDDTPLEIGEPTSLTSALSPEEEADLDSWAGSLGETSRTDPTDHRTDAESLPDDDPTNW